MTRDPEEILKEKVDQILSTHLMKVYDLLDDAVLDKSALLASLKELTSFASDDFKLEENINVVTMKRQMIQHGAVNLVLLLMKDNNINQDDQLMEVITQFIVHLVTRSEKNSDVYDPKEVIQILVSPSKTIMKILGRIVSDIQSSLKFCQENYPTNLPIIELPLQNTLLKVLQLFDILSRFAGDSCEFQTTSKLFYQSVIGIVKEYRYQEFSAYALRIFADLIFVDQNLFDYLQRLDIIETAVTLTAEINKSTDVNSAQLLESIFLFTRAMEANTIALHAVNS